MIASQIACALALKTISVDLAGRCPPTPPATKVSKPPVAYRPIALGERTQPLTQSGEALCVPRDDEALVAPANMHIHLAFRNVDADNGRRPSYPLLAQAGFAGGPSDCPGSMERLAKTTLGHPRDWCP